MKQIILVAAAVGAALLVAQVAPGQGTTYISNLEQPPVGSGAVGNDSWFAQPFITGTNSAGYVLDSVQLLMNGASGTPSGFTASIYSANGAPAGSLGSLMGADPTAGGLFSYAASGLTLSPGTYYYVVVTATTPIAQGAYQWSAADSFGRIFTAPGDPWAIPDLYYGSGNGSSWTFNARQNIFQFAVNATVVPEPASYSLAALSLTLLGLQRRSKRRSRGKRIEAVKWVN
jgi:hypothetical protein